jgi:hypothetical protein
MKVSLPKSFHHKISLWIKIDEKEISNTAEHEPTTNWLKKYDTYAHYLEGQNPTKIMNSLNFGSSIINPYHIFQIRKLPNLSTQMRILKERENTWFKIQNISGLNGMNRFLNITAIPLPDFAVTTLSKKDTYNENIQLPE